MSSRQTTIAVYADKDRIYCGESQDCCRCIKFQTSEMALFNVWRPHKGFVLFIYDNRYIISNWVKAILQVLIYKALYDKSYLGSKQLWLQVNGHAWFHLQRLRWPVRNGEGAKNSKWKYMSPAGFEPTPRQSTTGKLQRLRPLGHEGLMVISG